MKISLVLLFCLVVACTAEVYFQEEFDDGWEQRWVKSTHKGDDAGTYELSAGTYFADENDKGLKTKDDAKFYQISAAMTEFSNKEKTLVVQYSVKHEQSIDCGGGYVKLMAEGLDQDDFNGDSNYNVMFGPDICGTTKRIHLIFNYKGKNHLIKGEARAESDVLTHLYTLVVTPEQKYQIKVDGKEVKSGSLLSDWDFLPPQKIKDPKKSKPSDWVDLKKIDDPEAVKPEGYDDIPAQVVDADASKPDDWDDALDGEWEAPLIDNPEYKGEWKAPKIDNPAYKGEWVHPMIDNPDYSVDDEIYAFDSNAYIGLEIWQVRAGTIFDHFLVTDDVELAEKEANRIVKLIEDEKEHQRVEQEKVKAKTEEAADNIPDDLEEDYGDEVSDEDLKDEL